MTKRRDNRPQTADGGRRAIISRAEGMLMEMRALKSEILVHQNLAEAEIRELRGRHHKELAPRSEKLAELGKELTVLMKEEKAEIFDGGDKVELKHGFLYYARQIKISIPRRAVERIEVAGWTEAIRIAKSIDRAVVESWPLERLLKIGASRKLIESFSYETKPTDVKEGV